MLVVCLTATSGREEWSVLVAFRDVSGSRECIKQPFHWCSSFRVGRANLSGGIRDFDYVAVHDFEGKFAYNGGKIEDDLFIIGSS